MRRRRKVDHEDYREGVLCVSCGRVLERGVGQVLNVKWPGDVRTWEVACSPCTSELKTTGALPVERRHLRSRVEWVRKVGRQGARGDKVLWCEAEVYDE